MAPYENHCEREGGDEPRRCPDGARLHDQGETTLAGADTIVESEHRHLYCPGGNVSGFRGGEAWSKYQFATK